MIAEDLELKAIQIVPPDFKGKYHLYTTLYISLVSARASPRTARGFWAVYHKMSPAIIITLQYSG